MQRSHSCKSPRSLWRGKAQVNHLKRQASLDLFLKRLGHNAIELVQNLDGKLRLNTLGTD